MGRRGPPPLPDAMRKARGQKHRKKEPKRAQPPVTVGAPKAPAHLKYDPVALAAWRHLCKHLNKMRVLAPADGFVLEGMCMAYSHALAADKIVRRDGMIVTRKRGGIAAHPAVKVSFQAWRDVRMFAQEFGLTPSSRTRVHAVSDSPPQEGEKHQQAAEDFLFRSKGVIGHVGRDGRRKDDA
jgi:P27 family predicted phage terminase small subunit